MTSRRRLQLVRHRHRDPCFSIPPPRPPVPRPAVPRANVGTTFVGRGGGHPVAPNGGRPCYGCGGVGHVRQVCPSLKGSNTAAPAANAGVNRVGIGTD